MGSLRAVGPGMLRVRLPDDCLWRPLAVIIGFLDKKGPRLPTFSSSRGPFFIILGILCFAFLIRTVGLVAAGPVS